MLRWQYVASLGVAFALSFLIARAGLKYVPPWSRFSDLIQLSMAVGLMPISMSVILACLWAFGFHPAGFLVSPGGWIVFILTVFIAQALALIVVYLNRRSC
jgi:hypothetical protein